MQNKLIKKLKTETEQLISIYNNGNTARLESSARNYVKQFPEQGFGWKVLGVSLQKQGKFSEAVPAYRRAISLAPPDPELYNNLGVALKELTFFADAETTVRTALQLKPTFAIAHNNLGNILKAQGKLDEALHSYKIALELNPKLAIAYNNIGNYFKDSREHDKALEAYNASLEIDPKQMETLYNTGSLLIDMGKPEDAKSCFLKALDINAESPEIANIQGESLHLNSKTAWVQNMETARVVRLFGILLTDQRKLLASPLIHLTMSTLPIVVSTAEESQHASQNFSAALDELSIFGESGGWPDLGKSVAARLPFYLSYRPGNHKQVLSKYGDIAAEARRSWAKTNATKGRSASHKERSRVRIIMVCAQIRYHSVWFVMLKGLLKHIDRSRFEFIIYNTKTTQDSETDFARSMVDRFEQGPRDWLSLVIEDQPDIIFYPEAVMDTVSIELALLRLAPLQVMTWGHPITSGLPEMDIFFSGQLLESEEGDKHYRERLVRLPGTGACSVLMDHGNIALSPEIKNYLTFGETATRFLICQRPMKFEPEYDILYARIAAAGNAHFWFVRDKESPWASDLVENRIRAAFISERLDPDEYISWIDWIPGEQFGGLLEEMDVFLDTPAFSGFTTALRAAHCGLPIVTIEGDFLRQRLASGVLRRIGVIDTIAKNSDEFVSIAVELGKNRTKLAELRSRLRTAASLADEDVSVVRAFEDELLLALAEKTSPHLLSPHTP